MSCNEEPLDQASKCQEPLDEPREEPLGKVKDKRESSSHLEPSLEYVQTLSKEVLWDLALKYLKIAATKRELNRAYRQLDHVKDQRRKYYYVRNDIYHPVYNESGTIEKRHKRP